MIGGGLGGGTWHEEGRGRLVVEGRTPKETVHNLRERGHKVEVGDLWSEGRLCAVGKDGKMFKAGSNARGMQGYAAGR